MDILLTRTSDIGFRLPGVSVAALVTAGVPIVNSWVEKYVGLY